MDQKTPKETEPSLAVGPAGKARARAWFEQLQGLICASLEAVEDAADGLPGCEGKQAGRFVKTPWTRKDHNGDDGGGGTMALMCGRVFEKVGCHASTVYGTFAPEFAKQIPGADKDPRFWASGISFIAHPTNPNAPTAHMNTRMVVTSKGWFGGGGDLTPVLMRRRTQEDADSVALPRGDGERLRRRAVGRLSALQAMVRRVFLFAASGRDARHRRHLLRLSRHQATGRQTSPSPRRSAAPFSSVYPEIVRRNMGTPCSDADREEQLVRRGRYVEFNLLYDRGTIFGLKTGGNVDAILSSMPPLVRWP